MASGGLVYAPIAISPATNNPDDKDEPITPTHAPFFAVRVRKGSRQTDSGVGTQPVLSQRRASDAKANERDTGTHTKPVLTQRRASYAREKGTDKEAQGRVRRPSQGTYDANLRERSKDKEVMKARPYTNEGPSVRAKTSESSRARTNGNCVPTINFHDWQNTSLNGDGNGPSADARIFPWKQEPLSSRNSLHLDKAFTFDSAQFDSPSVHSPSFGQPRRAAKSAGYSGPRESTQACEHMHAHMHLYTQTYTYAHTRKENTYTHTHTHTLLRLWVVHGWL
jgi:hypothetical protein